MTETRWKLLIHGGAGSERIAHGGPEHEASARAGLNAALEAGAAILESGGSAVDAVEAAAAVTRPAAPRPEPGVTTPDVIATGPALPALRW